MGQSTSLGLLQYIPHRWDPFDMEQDSKLWRGYQVPDHPHNDWIHKCTVLLLPQIWNPESDHEMDSREESPHNI